MKPSITTKLPRRIVGGSILIVLAVLTTGCPQRKGARMSVSPPPTPWPHARTTPHTGTPEERVKECMAEILKVKRGQLVPAAHLQKNLGADELDLVEIVMAVEEEFDLEIHDDDAAKLHTVGDWVAYVQRHQQR